MYKVWDVSLYFHLFAENHYKYWSCSPLIPCINIKMIVTSGNGYCRSEGIVAILLQKERSAKRIYSTVVHSKTNSDGNKEQGTCILACYVYCYVD